MPLCLSTAVWGQNITKDTIRIDEVSVNTVRQAKIETNIGARTLVISDAVMRVNQTKSLAELLSENTAVYIKQLGQGALATASIRGTSSNHAQVNWNGIPINSPMLGNFDFSQVPALFADEVSLYYGNGYLKGGAGALGGSINLNNNYDKRVRSSEFKVLSEYGSNATITEATSARFSTGRLTSSTRLYYQRSKNNFRYLNKVKSKDQFYERRENAEYQKYGIMQQLYYDLPDNALLTANVWYQWFDRNLPQPIMVYRVSKEQQTSGTLRSYLSYSKESGEHSLKVTAAYLNDKLEYSRKFDISLGDEQTKNVSNSALVKGEYTYAFSPKAELNATLGYRYDQVRSDNYSRSKASRSTINAHVAALWMPFEKLGINAQVMTEVNAGRCVPTYSLGAKYQIIDKLLSIKASNAYNYRYPTLNDLYWNPGGNLDLKPEQGFSYDATLSWTPSISSVKFNFEGTYYRMDIDNWIMWIPTTNGYIWEPANFNKVLSQGVEFMAEANLKTKSVFHKIIFDYAYSPSEDRSSRGDGTLGKQLPYVPLNKWNVRYALNWKGLIFNYSLRFTDVRYTTADQSYSTNAYTTHEARLDYEFSIGKRARLKLSFNVDNLTNAYYENTQYYPMPLRNYNTAVMITF